MVKILIVEDEVLIRLGYESQLRALGWEYTSCASAEAALDAYQQTFYPLILTDMGLPGMDGIEFCRCIRALSHGVNSIIVMISASNTPENIRAAMDAGADEFLSKPLNLTWLQACIAAFAQKRSIFGF